MMMQTQQIGKYRIIARLGQGGMASVFLCLAAGPVGFNKLLVLKLLKEELAYDAEFLAMFLDEARLAARLNHANVVQTYEVGFEDGRHFLAMDYLDGQPLHAILRKQTREHMPLDIHVRILADTLAGLHYAHTLTDFDGTPLHVVHRDVSPQNVFVTYDGQVKLVDFGIAKAAGAATVTESGVFKGKIAYMAPEQAAGDPIDARADVFSVGVMLWEAIAGKRFSHGESQAAMLARRVSGNEPKIRDAVPDADPELADICDRAMAHVPEHRFASAQDFRDALESFLHRFSRRVGPREVGQLVSRRFAEEHDRIKAIIEEQMKQMLRETSQALPVPTLEPWANVVDHTPTAVSGRTRPSQLGPHSGVVGLDSVPSTGSGRTLVGANVSTPPPTRQSRTTLIVGLIAALVSVVGVVLVATIGLSGGAASSNAAPTPSATATAEPTDTIQLAVTFAPASATAKLDGVALLQSPFFAQMPRDGSAHTLEVTAPGFVPQTTMLSYDRDIAVNVALLEEKAMPATSATTSAPGPGPIPRVGLTPPPPPPPTGDGKKPLKIDEEDPYGKK
ncbi:MAG: serine/threonine protein kinase [Myxococcales bacterium]|nr:serine/threonine protein kinase [Myxococcales bacterium]